MIKDILGVCIYVDDFQRAYDFYTGVLGIEKSRDGFENSCFLRIADNPNAIYLEGGHERITLTPDSNTLSFMLMVKSAHEMYDLLKENDVRFIQDEPEEIGSGNYWFRFYDPAGNIVEIVSEAK